MRRIAIVKKMDYNHLADNLRSCIGIGNTYGTEYNGKL